LSNLANRQTDRQTDTGENIISLAKVMIIYLWHEEVLLANMYKFKGHSLSNLRSIHPLLLLYFFKC